MRLVVHIHNLQAPSLACIEQVVRHLFHTEKAVQRNPAAPDYGGLGGPTDGTVSAKGAAATSGFDAWIAEKQKEKRKQMQQERFYRDEMSKPSKHKAPEGEERAVRAARKPKAKAKA